VAGDLAAEDRALVAHAALEEGVADAVGVRDAAGARHDVGPAREARTS
jgi:hypothetical protein